VLPQRREGLPTGSWRVRLNEMSSFLGLASLGKFQAPALVRHLPVLQSLPCLPCAGHFAEVQVAQADMARLQR